MPPKRSCARYPGVEAVFTRTQLEQGLMPQTKLARQVTLAWHQQISGDIVDHEQAELVSVRQADHVRLDAWLAMVVRHQRTARDVRAELDQARQVRRLGSRRPRRARSPSSSTFGRRMAARGGSCQRRCVEQRYAHAKLV